MILYKEIIEAIQEVTNSLQQSEEFIARFSKLLKNLYDDSYSDSDISEAIETLILTEEK